jgi:hypothetical protein
MDKEDQRHWKDDHVIVQLENLLNEYGNTPACVLVKGGQLFSKDLISRYAEILVNGISWSILGWNRKSACSKFHWHALPETLYFDCHNMEVTVLSKNTTFQTIDMKTDTVLAQQTCPDIPDSYIRMVALTEFIVLLLDGPEAQVRIVKRSDGSHERSSLLCKFDDICGAIFKDNSFVYVQGTDALYQIHSLTIANNAENIHALKIPGLYHELIRPISINDGRDLVYVTAPERRHVHYQRVPVPDELYHIQRAIELPKTPHPILERMFQAKETKADLTFVVEDLEIPVHSAVLASCESKYFDKLMNSEMREGDNNGKRQRTCTRIVIHEIKHDIFNSLLEFIYLEKVPSGDTPLFPTLWDLLIACDRFDIRDLETRVIQIIVDRIRLGNVADKLQLLRVSFRAHETVRSARIILAHVLSSIAQYPEKFRELPVDRWEELQQENAAILPFIISRII